MSNVVGTLRVPSLAKRRSLKNDGTRSVPATMRRGGALIIALVTLLVVMLIAGAALRGIVAAHRRTRQAQDEAQAQWLAEGALARALVMARSKADYSGETWRPSISAENNGVAEIRIERPAGPVGALQVSIQAHYPDHEFKRVSVSREHVVGPSEAAP